MSTLRAGLSGCGARGAQAARLLRASRDCTLAALHDPDGKALHELGGSHAIGIRHQDFDALLQTGVDFVVLAGPCGDRLPQVEAAAAQGVHCLLHAPMAPDAHTARAMVAACDRAGVKLGLVIPAQADPRCEELRRLVSEDFLGAIVLIHATCADDGVLRNPPASSHWRRDPRRAGHGALRQVGSEALHLVHWLCGRAPLRVTAQTAHGLSALPQDSAVATLALRGGGLCTLAASHVASGNVLTLHGTDGHAIVTDEQISLRGRTALGDRLFDYGQPGVERTWSRAELGPAWTDRAPDLELHGRFARWIDDLDDFPCPGDLAAEDLLALEAIDRVQHPDRSEPV